MFTSAQETERLLVEAEWFKVNKNLKKVKNVRFIFGAGVNVQNSYFSKKAQKWDQ